MNTECAVRVIADAGEWSIDGGPLHGLKLAVVTAAEGRPEGRWVVSTLKTIDGRDNLQVVCNRESACGRSAGSAVKALLEWASMEVIAQSICASDTVPMFSAKTQRDIEGLRTNVRIGWPKRVPSLPYGTWIDVTQSEAAVWRWPRHLGNRAKDHLAWAPTMIAQALCHGRTLDGVILSEETSAQGLDELKWYRELPVVTRLRLVGGGGRVKDEKGVIGVRTMGLEITAEAPGNVSEKHRMELDLWLPTRETLLVRDGTQASVERVAPLMAALEQSSGWDSANDRGMRNTTALLSKTQHGEGARQALESQLLEHCKGRVPAHLELALTLRVRANSQGEYNQ